MSQQVKLATISDHREVSGLLFQIIHVARGNVGFSDAGFPPPSPFSVLLLEIDRFPMFGRVELIANRCFCMGVSSRVFADNSRLKMKQPRSR